VGPKQSHCHRRRLAAECTLDLFAKQTRVKGDGRKCGNGKDATIRITFQNVFTGIAEFGQERDAVTGR